MKSIIVIWLFVCFFLSANGQTIKNNKFTNEKIGVSFHFDKTWSVSYDEEPPMLTASNFDKTEMITFHYIKQKQTEPFKKFTQAELTATKLAYKRKYEYEGHTVISVEVYNDRFMNYNGFTVRAHLKDQDYMSGIPIYKKQISFITNRGYLVSFIYIIPERIYTAAEISYVEGQLRTFSETK